MSITYQSPTKSWNDSEHGILSCSSAGDHHSLQPSQEFINQIQKRKNFQSATHHSDQSLDSISSTNLSQLLSTNTTQLLLIDIRSGDHYSKSHILSAIHVTIPSILLKRPNYTLDKVTESLKDNDSIQKFRNWASTAYIVFYDHSSNDSGASVTASLLAKKFIQSHYKGTLAYLLGGFEKFQKSHPTQCNSNQTSDPTSDLSLSMPLPTSTATPAHSPFFFFNNIRQNLELAHGPLKERFAIRVPHERTSLDNGIIQLSASPTHPPRYGLGGSSIDARGNFVLPSWLDEMMGESGPRKLAESYEALERAEQERLDFVMRYHSSHHTTDFPLSIASSMEKGALNRYNNIWPFEYSRVKLTDKKDDFINANFLQYAEAKDDAALFPATPMTTVEKDIVQSGLLSQDSLDTMRHPEQVDKDRKYIATQGPLPTTFADFWKMIWDQKSNVIVMLTNEEELEKAKCHRYWPSIEENYGSVTVRLLSEDAHPVINANDKRERKEQIIVRRFQLKHRSSLFQNRIVTHLQYTGWSDFGVPDTPIGLLQLVHLVNESHLEGPLTVHCSAGCGRTGTFCVVDTVIQRLWQERDVYTSSSVDKIKETVSRLREQRMSSVQTHRQYVFCYEAILWWLLGYGHLPAME